VDIEAVLNKKFNNGVLNVRQLKTASKENSVSTELQQTLDRIAARATDRKYELVEMLSNEQPVKSGLVDEQYLQCIWWEGCYYCQDDDKQWHRVQCFM
jgi:hypothetical protein